MSASMVHGFSLPGRGDFLGVVAKRAYRFARTRRATPIADALIKVAIAATIGESESDLLGFARAATDVTLFGHAYSARGSIACDTAVEVGPARKCVRVHGDRRIVV